MILPFYFLRDFPGHLGSLKNNLPHSTNPVQYHPFAPLGTPSPYSSYKLQVLLLVLVPIYFLETTDN